MNKLVSVIVPIYNVEAYLEKCITSIINQTYTNIEIILINDGSTDTSLKICQEYQKLDNRIIILNKNNEGLSAARNDGIAKSKGKYICFIDGDDYISPNYIEKLYNDLTKHKADISVCNFYYENYQGSLTKKKECQNQIYTSTEALKDIFLIQKNLEIMVWNKLYKKELFTKNNITFPKSMIHEDNFVTYKLFAKSKRISLINDKLYYYVQRNNSITNTYSKKRLDVLKSIDEIKAYFISRKDLNEAINCYEFSTYLTIINLLIDKKEDPDTLNKLIKIIKNNKKSYLNNSLIPNIKKIQLRILITSKFLYKIILNTLHFKKYH